MKENLTIVGKVRATLRDARTGEITMRLPWHHNIIPDVGLTAIAGLIGRTVTTGITYGAVGDGSTTPAAGSTAMGNETARKAIATASVTDQNSRLRETGRL